MTHNLTSQNFPHFQNRNQGLNEAGVGTGTGQIYPHPINTLIDPTQNRGMEQPRQMHHQQSQHPNPHMQQSYGAGPQPHMSMRNGQTPTIQLPPNATLTSSTLGPQIALRSDQQYVLCQYPNNATMITQPSMIPQQFYQPVYVSGAVGPNQYYYPPQAQQFPQQSYGNIQMAQQYQAQQQSMSEQQQQPMQSNVIQTQPAPQISAPAPRAKKTLAIKDPNTLEAINAMDITQPRQKSTTNTEQKEDGKSEESERKHKAVQNLHSLMAKIAEDGTKTSTKVEEPDKDVLLIENQIDAMNLDQNQNKSALQLEQVTETKTQPQVPDNFAKPVPNAESSATYEKYVPKKTPDFMPETKIEAKQESPVITEKMAAQYEQKRDSYHQDPTQCRINDHFYNRDFLLLMRDLVRELGPIDPPRSETQLVELGLNRGVETVPLPISSSNTVRSRKFETPDNFRMDWQSSQSQPNHARLNVSRPNYPGRNSDKLSNRRKGNISRPSMTEQSKTKQEPLPHLPVKSDTAWKTNREMKFDPKAKSLDDQKYDKLAREIRGLLNKITPTTYPDLSDDFIKYGVHNDEILLERVIGLIFEKAVEEPHFCSLYSDLCKKQCDHELGSQQVKAKTFRQGIINRCQNTFAPSSEKIAELEKKITEDSDEKLKASILEEIELVKSKEKRRLLGIIKFIAQLYRRKLLNDLVITWCIIELVKKNKELKDEIYVEYAVQMIETVGELYEKKDGSDKPKNDPKQTPPQAWGGKKAIQEEKNQFEDIFSHISGLKNTVSNRIRFMILDMEELRSNNWKPRGGDKGPKTVDAVRNELEQEQQQNEEERISYEQKKQEMRRGEGGNKRAPYSQRSSGQSHYGGRASSDNRFSSNQPFDRGDRRGGPSPAASSLNPPPSNHRRDTKLSEIDSMTLKRQPAQWFQNRQQQKRNEPTPPPDATNRDSEIKSPDMAIEEGQNLELDGQSKSRSPEQDISNSSNCLPKISDSDGREGDRRIKEEKNDTDGTDGKGDESRVSTTDPKNYPATEKDKQREDASKESPPKSDQPIDQKDSSVHPNDTK